MTMSLAAGAAGAAAAAAPAARPSDASGSSPAAGDGVAAMPPAAAAGGSPAALPRRSSSISSLLCSDEDATPSDSEDYGSSSNSSIGSWLCDADEAAAAFHPPAAAAFLASGLHSVHEPPLGHLPAPERSGSGSSSDWLIGTATPGSRPASEAAHDEHDEGADDPLLAAAHAAIAAASALAPPGTAGSGADLHTLLNSGAVLLLGHGSTTINALAGEDGEQHSQALLTSLVQTADAHAERDHSEDGSSRQRGRARRQGLLVDSAGGMQALVGVPACQAAHERRGPRAAAAPAAEAAKPPDDDSAALASGSVLVLAGPQPAAAAGAAGAAHASVPPASSRADQQQQQQPQPQQQQRAPLVQPRRPRQAVAMQPPPVLHLLSCNSLFSGKLASNASLGSGMPLGCSSSFMRLGSFSAAAATAAVVAGGGAARHAAGKQAPQLIYLLD